MTGSSHYVVRQRCGEWSSVFRPLRLLSSLLIFFAVCGWGAETPERPRWEAMDYGPYLTASIEAPEPRTNIAYKGIAINLGANWGGDRNEAIVFDTDLLRYSAGWTGDFVALKGVVFDGEHWAYPSINGDQVFGNPVAPGWARSGNFSDPRQFHFGPLPRDWAHWNGLYLKEKKVVFSYSVGETSVLEMPCLEQFEGLTAFARILNLGPAAQGNAVQILSDPHRRSDLLDLDTVRAAPADSPANHGLAVLDSQEATNTSCLAVGVVGAGPAARWRLTEAGDVRLDLPPSASPARCKVLLWRGPKQALPDFARLVKASALPPDLAPYTHGGAPRWPQRLLTHGQLGTNAGPYAIDTLTEPEPNPWHSWMRFGGIDFFPDGKRAAVCTWNGDVWILSGVDGDLKDISWQRIATGLFQPLGLQIVDGQIYVLGRDQITRLHDLNGDGEIDYYENFNNDCMTSEHFHEFALDLKLGPDGNFYYIKCACHGVPASHPHHGTLMRVSRDGSKLEVVARGFRAANGLGVGPHGELTSIDNQGFWMPANRINWIQPGGWYGNQWAWNPTGRTNYDEPLCWMHNFVDRSGGTQLWVPTAKWGPFQNEVITLSYGMGHMFLLLKESVNGVMQGAVTRFPLEFETGVMRGVFHPESGQLYGCGLYGWAGNKTRAGGVYRVRYTGQAVHMASELHFVRDGIVLGFTDALDADSATDPGNYDVKAWNYHWTINYGSPDFRLNGQEGRDTWPVESATLSADHKRVFLHIPDIQRVMQLHVVFNLQAADGARLENFVHGTIHNLDSKSGLDWLGAGVVTQREKAEPKLTREASGLIQMFSTADHSELQDCRHARLAALYVPAGANPTPFLPPGRFRCRWEGFLKMELNDEVSFTTAGQGEAVLKVNGQTLLESQGEKLDGLRTQPVRLRRGLNRFELEYRSPPAGAAVFRLGWMVGRIAEPVPPTAFVYDASDPRLESPVLLRSGRQLFAELRCARCHQPNAPWGPTAMPELSAEGPSLDGIGDRLNPRWITEWLVEPRTERLDARMPRVFSGSEAYHDAATVAAYLATLKEPRTPNAALILDTNDVASGRKLFNDLGCAGCHLTSESETLTNDARLALVHVAEKWQPQALADYLSAPAQHWRWTAMPDFKLNHEEAARLGAYLLVQSQPGSVSKRAATNDLRSADLARGRELVETRGCLGCHALQGRTNRLVAPSLAKLTKSSWSRGCMAETPSGLGQAPVFSLNSVQKAALRAFSQVEFSTSLKEDADCEFAERQYTALRCQACHSRDGETDLLTHLAARSASTEDADEAAMTGSRTVHVGRPLLTFAGEKLYSTWMERFLAGRLGYKPRPELQGRMPFFPAYATGLASGLAHQHGYPAEAAPTTNADSGLAEIGHRLVGVTDGFSCIACHNVGEQKALAGKDTATVNFACIAERLRPGYYWRYVQDPPHLLPGTMMPKFIAEDGTTQVKSVYNGDPQKQFTAIWNYLLSLPPPPAQP
jgi:mono/diheme cytochrome c family protein